MPIQQNVDLSPFNTFRVPAKAKYFFEAYGKVQIQKLLKSQTFNSIFILGLGANILFTGDFDGLIIKNNLKGIKVLEENEDQVILQVASGENWHEIVKFSVENGWSGIENLALIPSTVGAAVTQNIAAYGQNLEDVFQSLEALDLTTLETVKFSKADCQFAYRDSLFKKPDYKNFFITSVNFVLSKTPIFNTSYHSRYESLEAELKNYSQPYTPKQIFEAVVNLRKSKLPDWTKMQECGY